MVRFKTNLQLLSLSSISSELSQQIAKYIFTYRLNQ